jgi:hypothetical protein
MSSLSKRLTSYFDRYKPFLMGKKLHIAKKEENLYLSHSADKASPSLPAQGMPRQLRHEYSGAMYHPPSPKAPAVHAS